ncbi:MAG: cytochrome P460 family protein [Thiovulaceae bacterium]|nr:cytochrome P460 family protein [Sulfurimonadaceae bacterium]
MLQKIVLSLLTCTTLLLAFSENELPMLEMKDTKLAFKDIAGYSNYKIVATHFRKDQNELRYILANPIAYKALKNKEIVMPDGSKIVKIGWKVKEMTAFPAAFEADKIQRVEYMIKDKTKHKESDGWGYARFIKKGDEYKAWDGDVNECVSCHAIMNSNDFLFTKFQPIF